MTMYTNFLKDTNRFTAILLATTFLHLLPVMLSMEQDQLPWLVYFVVKCIQNNNLYIINRQIATGAVAPKFVLCPQPKQI